MADDTSLIIGSFSSDVEKYLTYLRNVRGLSGATVKAYRRDLESFVAFLEETEVSELGTDEVRHFVRVMIDRGMAPGSVNRHLSALRGFFRFRGQSGGDPANPAAHVRSVKQAKRLPEALFEREMELLLNFSTDTFGDLRDRVLMEILYSTGARISEVCNADMDSLVFSRQAILVRGKGNRDRYVFLGSDALGFLREYVPRRIALLRRFGRMDEKALIINQKGRRLTPRGAAYRIAQRFDQSGLSREVGPHGFRHSFATHILNHGADIRVVQELLGHQRLATTQVYTHVGLDRLKQVYSRSHPHAQGTAAGHLSRRDGRNLRSEAEHYGGEDQRARPEQSAGGNLRTRPEQNAGGNLRTRAEESAGWHLKVPAERNAGEKRPAESADEVSYKTTDEIPYNGGDEQ